MKYAGESIRNLPWADALVGDCRDHGTKSPLRRNPISVGLTHRSASLLRKVHPFQRVRHDRLVWIGRIDTSEVAVFVSYTAENLSSSSLRPHNQITSCSTRKAWALQPPNRSNIPATSLTKYITIPVISAIAEVLIQPLGGRCRTEVQHPAKRSPAAVLRRAFKLSPRNRLSCSGAASVAGRLEVWVAEGEAVRKFPML